MGKFEDFLNASGNAVELPEEFKVGLLAAHNEDFSGATAKIETLETQITEKDGTINQLNTDFGQQISSLKAANYDLLLAVPGNARSDNADDKGLHDDEDDVDIEDFFKTPTKESV